MKKTILSFLFLFSIGLSISPIISAQAELYDLQCEALKNPLGIDNISPNLSWKIKSERNGFKQLYYQILAASDEKLLSKDNGDLWDSGKVKSDKSVWIPYSGKALKSRSLVYWKVRIWDEKGNVTTWSENASFSIGLLSTNDWDAVFIGGAITEDAKAESPLLRKTFNCTGEGQISLLHVNSLGYHDIYINGQRIGDAVLTPAVSQLDKRSLVVTYDISSFLKKGENDLVLWLGKGWYRNQGVVSGGPYVRAQLETYSKGKWINLVNTDEAWFTRGSGYSDPGKWTAWQFEGEIINANELLPDFTSGSLNSVGWEKARCAKIPRHVASPQMAEPDRIQKTVNPISVKQLNDSTWIFDIGTNITGWTEIKFPQLRENQKIKISYCDFLNNDGSFRDKNDCDYYIASGKNNETFINKFNYHAYRYIKITNLRECPALSDISSYLIHTDYGGNSSFSCSDRDLNAIHDMVQYTLRCLTIGGYVVDCPHLERLGYGGDGNASTLTVQTMYNFAPLYGNWIQAWADCIREDGSMPHIAPCPCSAGGGPYWCGFIITGSWQTYVNYGDKRLIKKHYPVMKKWLEYVKLYMKDGLLKQWPDTEYRNWYLGDWATPEGIDQTNALSIDLVANCFVSNCYNTMEKIAGILGYNEDKNEFATKRDELNNRIHFAFYNPERKSYSTGTQIDLVYPLLVGATPLNITQDVINTLHKETEKRFNGHLSAGLVGVPVITQWVTQTGSADYMYNMLKKREYPGYLYMIDNGATTTWEHWNGERSHIHNCYNSIGSWFYQALGGIIPDEEQAGYRHVLIQPQLIKGIEWVKVLKDTPFGNLSVEWKLADDKYILDVDIPVGCSATVTLPVNGKIFINGNKNNSEIMQVESGKYQIISEL